MPRKDALSIIKLESNPSSKLDAKLRKLEGEGGGRDYELTDEGILIYESKGGQGEDLNAVVEDKHGKEIACRHLVGYLMSRPEGIKDYHDEYADEESIQEVPYLNENVYDDDPLDQSSTYYNFVALEDVGQTVHSLASELEVGEETRFFMDSENHSMGLSIARKETEDGSQYVIKFYDPNITDKHTRIICPDLERVGQLKIDHLMDESTQEQYFPKFRTISLYSANQAPDKRPISVESSEHCDRDSKLYHALICNLPEEVRVTCDAIVNENPTSLIGQLEASNDNLKPGLQCAMHNRAKDSLQAYMQYIGRSDELPSDKKKSLLTATDGKNITALDLATGHPPEMIEIYLEGILNAELDEESKLDILKNAAKGQCFIEKLGQKEGMSALVSSYASAIASSSLSPQSIKSLLRPEGAKIPVLFSIERENSEAVGPYMDAVMGSKLAESDKVELLSAKNPRYGPVLHNAMKKGSAEASLLMADKILSTTELSAQSKIELLMAEHKGTPGIHAAIESGNTELATDFFHLLDKHDMAKPFLETLRSQSDSQIAQSVEESYLQSKSTASKPNAEGDISQKADAPERSSQSAMTKSAMQALKSQFSDEELLDMDNSAVRPK